MLFLRQRSNFIIPILEVLERREPIEQIWREKLTVPSRELANSLKQPFCLLSFQLEVKVSASPELDFLTMMLLFSSTGLRLCFELCFKETQQLARVRSLTVVLLL